MFVCVSVYVYFYVYRCMFVCVSVYVGLYICVHMYSFIKHVHVIQGHHFDTLCCGDKLFSLEIV